jgi:hypothetical protein
MPRDDQDKNLWEESDTTSDALKDALGEIFKDPADNDPDEPRVNPVMRWANFLVIILALGLVVGGMAAWWTYSSAAHGPGSRLTHQLSDKTLSDQQWHETVQDIRRNFLVGFCLGGAIGVSYAIKCLVRGVDP